MSKTVTLIFRIEPKLKGVLRCAADREHRSIANMVEVLIRGYIARNGISNQKFGKVFTNEEDN